MLNWLENIVWFVVIRMFNIPEITEVSQWDVLKSRLEHIKEMPLAREPGSFAVYEFPEVSFNEFVNKLVDLEQHIRARRLEKHHKAAVFTLESCYYNEYFSNGSKRHTPERIRHILVTRILAITMLFEKMAEGCNDHYTTAFYQRRVEAAIEACLIVLETFYHDK